MDGLLSKTFIFKEELYHRKKGIIKNGYILPPNIKALFRIVLNK
jgi:hypothetical protein